MVLIVTIAPLHYVLMASLSTATQVFQRPFLFLPAGFTLGNYLLVLKNPIIWSGYGNSILYLVIGVLINLAMTVLAAYPLSRKELAGRRIILKLLVLTMYLSGGMIPTYLVVRGLGLRDSLWAMVLPCAVNAFMIFVSISFFENTIPLEVQESATIDGCTNMQILLRIILPLSVPLLGVLALQYGLGHWKAYAQALIYLQTRSRFPLQLVLREILVKIDSQTMLSMLSRTDDYETMTNMKEGVKHVSMVVTSLPLLVVYPYLRRFFETGMTLGAVKE